MNGMYKIIKNEKLLSEWLGSEENTLREVLLQKRVKTHLYTAVGILDEVYGSDRDIKKDLGGYVIIFYGEQKEAERQFKSCLKEYYLKEDDFEFEDIYESSSGGKCIIFRLYLCSSDYSVLAVIVHDK